MPKVRIAAIVAMDEARVIGRAGELPWHISEDLRRFSRLTTGHAVLMGRKTYQSLPEKYCPLPGRLNIVLTRNREWQAPEGVLVYPTIESALAEIESGKVTLPGDTVWIGGGAEVFLQTIDRWDEVYLTRVAGHHDGDTFMPEFESQFELLEREDGPACVFERYRRQ